jgi:Zn-dependent peptidase ImmA (M78 family)
MSEYKATPTSRNHIRHFVKHIRTMIGYTNSLYFPIVEFVELCLPDIFPDFELEIIPHEEMKNKCGETSPSQHKIILNENIYYQAVDGDGFARLTVAHEVGHLFLHDTNSISLCKLQPGETLKAFEDPEWQADVFGAELLAPSYLIQNMNEYEISDKCGITHRAASVQKSKL